MGQQLEYQTSCNNIQHTLKAILYYKQRTTGIPNIMTTYHHTRQHSIKTIQQTYDNLNTRHHAMTNNIHLKQYYEHKTTTAILENNMKQCTTFVNHSLCKRITQNKK